MASVTTTSPERVIWAEEVSGTMLPTLNLDYTVKDEISMHHSALNASAWRKEMHFNDLMQGVHQLTAKLASRLVLLFYK